jgi:hypothetical protein
VTDFLAGTVLVVICGLMLWSAGLVGYKVGAFDVGNALCAKAGGEYRDGRCFEKSKEMTNGKR